MAKDTTRIKEKALKLYLTSGGKMSSAEIAAKVKSRPNIIGLWKKKENWEAQLSRPAVDAGKPEKEAVSQVKPEGKPRRRTQPTLDKTPVLRKREKFDKALALFTANPTITNTALASQVKVSQATIAKWKTMPEWTPGTQESLGLPKTIRAESVREIKREVPTLGISGVGLFEALVRIDKAVDAQIQESIGLKTEIRFLMESMRRGG